jgi:hypothetical protein
MELIPLLRFWRDLRTGAGAGAVVAVGFTTWRVTREGDLAWTALALLGAAALFGAILGLYFWRWVPRHWDKAGPMPGDAEVMASHKTRWWALLGGLTFGFAAVGKAADNSVIFSGVLTGMVVGALAAFTVAITRLQRRQSARGQELLQWRRGRLRNPCHYLRELDRPAPHRFTRERAATPAREHVDA